MKAEFILHYELNNEQQLIAIYEDYFSRIYNYVLYDLNTRIPRNV